MELDMDVLAAFQQVTVQSSIFTLHQLQMVITLLQSQSSSMSVLSFSSHPLAAQVMLLVLS